MSLGIGLYFIPLAMIANDEIIKLDTEFLYAIIAFLKIAFSLVLLSYSLISANFIIFKIIAFGFGMFVMFI